MTLQDSTEVSGPGHYGAKVQSWRKNNPRDVLKTIMADDDGDRATVFKIFRRRIFSESGKPYLEAILEYWFTNNYNSLMHERGTAKTTPEEVGAVSREYKARLQRHVVKTARVMLLDWVLPNGKKLADCTGRECSALAKKIGPWLQNVAGAIKPSERVGDRLSEAELRDLYKAG